MCGIVGVISKENVVPLLTGALKKLEYRGYDSCGISLLNDEINTYKKVGYVQNLIDEIEPNLSGSCGIGHTRWATHGLCNLENCHPHISYDNMISLVHNGTISNYLELKNFLVEQDESIKFIGDTDSEVVSHLLAYYYKKTKSVYECLKTIIDLIKGTYAIVFIVKDQKDTLYFLKNFSPLFVSLGKNKTLIASDLYVLPANENTYEIKDETYGIIESNKLSCYSNNGRKIIEKINNTANNFMYEKSGYHTYMEKELNEVSNIIDNISTYVPYSKSHRKFLRYIKNKRVIFIGCGTSYNACLFGSRFIENESQCYIASAFYEDDVKISNHDVFVVVSQSGETADVLRAMSKIRKHKNKIICICNNDKSTIARRSDLRIDMMCQKEISVASTKCYYATITLLYLLGKKEIPITKFDAIRALITNIRNNTKHLLCIEKWAKELSNLDIFYLIGRKEDYDLLKEAALKFQEICYINVITLLGGELKHGPIALFNQDSTILCLNTNPDLLNVNLEEIKSRGANLYEISNVNENNEKRLVINVTNTYGKIYFVFLFHYLALFIAKEKGIDVDRPRNLAKSVTVE